MLLIGVLVIMGFSAAAQVYITKNGSISFFSKTSMENIQAQNNQVVSIVNLEKGDIAFSVLIKGFVFKKALMQEHFNEDYLESDKYQKATFRGLIENITSLSSRADGSYPVNVSGELIMHGVARKVTIPGKITIAGGKVSAHAEFNVLLSNYNISVPKLVENNISPTIRIQMDCKYEPRN